LISFKGKIKRRKTHHANFVATMLCIFFFVECMQELAAMPMPCGEQRESDGAGWVNTEPMKGPYLT
jgi:hypothetical protein